MCVADALWLARRMQRIAEEDQPCGRKAVRHDVGGDPSAHRFATQERPSREGRRNGFSDGAIACLEPRLRIWRSAPGLRVREIEANDSDATRRQRFSDLDEKARVHV